jgi:hypothetical protein
MIRLYGAVDDPAVATVAFENATVLYAAGTVACIGRECASNPLEPDRRTLIDHDALLRNLMDVCTVVPFRFDTVVVDHDQFHAALDARAGDLAELLKWLRGRVELAVRAGIPASRPRCARSGREYLRRMVPVHSSFHQVLAGRAVASAVSRTSRGNLQASYLVERDDTDDFCHQVSLAAESLPRPSEVSLTGPWPPYSFTSVVGRHG